MTVTTTPLERGNYVIAAASPAGIPTAYITHAAIATLEILSEPHAETPEAYVDGTTPRLSALVDMVAQSMGIERTDYTDEVVRNICRAAHGWEKADALAVSRAVRERFTGR